MMKSFKLSEIAQAVGAEYTGKDRKIQFVSTDTREIEDGALFVALTGDRFDGNEFIEEAFEKGASACIVSHFNEHESAIQVVDTALAYAQIGLLNRNEFKGSLVALTGSAGKTTTKEMLACILQLHGDTLKTFSNLNNTIGVPKTLLGLSKNHKFGVIEMGANNVGEIALSTSMTCPDIAIILNSSEAHTEGFKNLSGVRKAKGEILEGLSDTGYAILNVNDAGYAYWKGLLSNTNAKLLGFGVDSECADLNAIDISIDDQGCAKFDVQYQGAGWASVRLSVPGIHQVSNALAAISASILLGLSPEQILPQLENFTGISGRISRHRGINDSVIFDDTYNASPASMVAAIDFLATLPGKHILVLADMAELGSQEEKQHKLVADYAKTKISDIRAFGSAFSEVLKGRCYSDKKSLIADLIEDANPGVSILVKGANSMKMNAVVAALVQKDKS